MFAFRTSYQPAALPSLSIGPLTISTISPSSSPPITAASGAPDSRTLIAVPSPVKTWAKSPALNFAPLASSVAVSSEVGSPVTVSDVDSVVVVGTAGDSPGWVVGAPLLSVSWKPEIQPSWPFTVTGHQRVLAASYTVSTMSMRRLITWPSAALVRISLVAEGSTRTLTFCPFPNTLAVECSSA